MNRHHRLTIDTALPERVAADARRDLKIMASGVALPLSPSDTKRVIFSKYEARTPGISDTHHGDKWLIQTGVHPNIAKMLDDGSTQSITEDDGLIIDFIGVPTAEVAIDLRGGRIMQIEEAESQEEVLGRAFPRYMRYDFFIDRMLLTDGPARRLKLQESAEEQRNRDQGDLMKMMTDVFSRLGANMAAGPDAIQQQITASPQELLQQLATQLTPDQLRAQLDMLEDPGIGADAGPDAGEPDIEAALEDAEALK